MIISIAGLLASHQDVRGQVQIARFLVEWTGLSEDDALRAAEQIGGLEAMMPADQHLECSAEAVTVCGARMIGGQRTMFPVPAPWRPRRSVATKLMQALAVEESVATDVSRRLRVLTRILPSFRVYHGALEIDASPTGKCVLLGNVRSALQ